MRLQIVSVKKDTLRFDSYASRLSEITHSAVTACRCSKYRPVRPSYGQWLDQLMPRSLESILSSSSVHNESRNVVYIDASSAIITLRPA